MQVGSKKINLLIKHLVNNFLQLNRLFFINQLITIHNFREVIHYGFIFQNVGCFFLFMKLIMLFT